MLHQVVRGCTRLHHPVDRCRTRTFTRSPVEIEPLITRAITSNDVQSGLLYILVECTISGPARSHAAIAL